MGGGGMPGMGPGGMGGGMPGMRMPPGMGGRGMRMIRKKWTYFIKI